MLMCLEATTRYQMNDKQDSVFAGDGKTPEKRKRAQLSLNDLEKWRNNSSSSSTTSTTPLSTTITPTQILFPRHVTEEQEAYARGFSQALEEIYKKQGYPIQQQQLQQQHLKSTATTHATSHSTIHNKISTNNPVIATSSNIITTLTCSSTNPSMLTPTDTKRSTRIEHKTTITTTSATTTNVKPTTIIPTTIIPTTSNYISTTCNATTFFQNINVLNLQQQQATTNLQPAFIPDTFYNFPSINSSTLYNNKPLGFNSINAINNNVNNSNNHLIKNTNNNVIKTNSNLFNSSNNKKVYAPLINVSALYSSPLNNPSVPANNNINNNNQQLNYTQSKQFSTQNQSFSSQNQSFSSQNQSFSSQNQSFSPQNQSFHRKIHPSTSYQLNSPPQLPSFKSHPPPPPPPHPPHHHQHFESFSSNFLLNDSPKTSLNVATLNLEGQERLRLERKRAKNRVAAQKCQLRKVERINVLEGRVLELRERNKEYKCRTDQLRAAVETLKASINLHVSKGCRILSHTAYHHNDLLPFGS